jgi:uncharacterized protein YoxC
MELTMTISVAVIAAIMVVAVICIIPVLLQIRRTAQQVEKLVEAARMQVAPLSRDLTVISQTATGIMQSVQRQTDKLEESVATVRDGVERLRDFQDDVLRRVEQPLFTTSALFGAINQGVSTFCRILRR